MAIPLPHEITEGWEQGEGPPLHPPLKYILFLLDWYFRTHPGGSFSALYDVLEGLRDRTIFPHPDMRTKRREG